MNTPKTIALIFFAVVFFVPTAWAQSLKKIGKLTCELENISSQVKRLPEAKFSCIFDRDSGSSEAYTAEVLGIGDDYQFENQLELVWEVLVPDYSAREMVTLGGSYVDGSEDVALANGIIARELLGLGENLLTLKPVMFSGIVATGSVRIQFLKLN